MAVFLLRPFASVYATGLLVFILVTEVEGILLVPKWYCSFVESAINRTFQPSSDCFFDFQSVIEQNICRQCRHHRNASREDSQASTATIIGAPEAANEQIPVEQLIDALSVPYVIDGSVVRVHQRKELEEIHQLVTTYQRLSAKFHRGVDNVSQSEFEKGSLYFEGDILLTKEQLGELLAIRNTSLLKQNETTNARRKRKVTPSRAKWPRDIYVDVDASGRNQPLLMQNLGRATRFWSQHTCLRFHDGPPPSNGVQYLFVQSTGGGCSSAVGMINTANHIQGVSLSKGCYEQWGTPAHELAHALGMFHEQNRPDRDNYVQIIRRNILLSSQGNYEKCTDVVGDCRADVAYDYASVMHYGIGFSALGGRPAMKPTDRNYASTMGQRYDGPTFSDVKQMNLLYCNASCTTSSTTCENGGYPNPSNCALCNCPRGFGGERCTDTTGNCGGKLTATNNWQTLSSPNYPQPFTVDQHCAWLIQAPVGKTVELRFDSFDMEPASPSHGCHANYVEVRYLEDKTISAPFLCGSIGNGKKVVSQDRQLMMLFDSHRVLSPRFGFRAQFRIVGGISSSTTSTLPSTTTAPTTTTDFNTTTTRTQCVGFACIGFGVLNRGSTINTLAPGIDTTLSVQTDSSITLSNATFTTLGTNTTTTVFGSTNNISSTTPSAVNTTAGISNGTTLPNVATSTQCSGFACVGVGVLNGGKR